MQSKTDWGKLKTKAGTSDASEHPEADVRHIVRGVVRRGLKPQPPKAAISLRLEQDVLEWFGNAQRTSRDMDSTSSIRLPSLAA